MSRPAALVVGVALLLVASGIAAAAHTQAVSRHDTTSDFSGATALENVSVNSGSVTFPDGLAQERWDGFEDSDINEWSGDTGQYAASTAHAHSGDFALRATAPGGLSHIISRPVPVQQPTRVSVWHYQDSVNENGYVSWQNTGTDGLTVQIRADGSVFVQESSTTFTDTGIDVTGGEWHELRAEIDWATHTFELTVRDDSGTVLGTVTGLQFRTNIPDINALEVQTTGERYWDDFDYALTKESGAYTSQPHQLSNVQTGYVDLSSVTDASAEITWQGRQGGGWTDVTTQTVTTAGNYSTDLSTEQYPEWRVRVEMSTTGAEPQVTLTTEGVAAATATPSVDNAAASPQGNPTLTSAPTLSVDGTDADFATTQGDTVTVRWFVDGSQVATTTETANGTWSYDPETTAGSTQWRVEVTDSYGHTTQSQTFSFTTPAELEIYNESAPNSLINGAEVEIRYFFDESDPQNSLVVTRTTNNGTVNMTGLPADKPFVVVAKADGYQSRRIYVESLFATQQIYLLPDAEESATVTFDLQDYSGEFPQEDTVLIIQRALDDKYETVHADRFGAAGEFPATLRFGARHRLIVRNTETGAERVVGPYTPIVNTQQTITVQSQGDPTLATDVRVTMKPGLRQVQNGSAVSVTASIASDAGRLDSYQVRYLVKEPASTQTATLATATGTQPTGETISETLDLTGRAGAQLLVVVEYTMTDGTTHTETVRYRITDSYGSQIGLLPTLESMPTLLADGTTDMVTTLISVVAALAMLASAASLGASTEAVGITGVVTLAGFGVIGWVGYGLVFAAGGAWVAMSALRRVV